MENSSSKYYQTRYEFDEGRKIVWKAICEYLQPHVSDQATVVDLAAGYCDFINQITAKKKIAIDINAETANFCGNDVTFVNSSTQEKINIEKHSVDVLFSSNFLEHLDDAELDSLFAQIDDWLKPLGTLILIQPNYFYAYRNYWDDFTHKKAFSHASLCDFLESKDFQITQCEKKFIPFSFKSRLPKSYWLTKLYLNSPIRPQAKQMLVIAQKKE